MVIEREISISRPIEAVFAFVSDPVNDVSWCRKVQSVTAAGEGRWEVVHKPVPGRPARRMSMTRVAFSAPTRIEWLEDDGVDVFRVSYALSPTGSGATRFVQRSEASVGAVPRWLWPLWRFGIGRDVARQLRDLKKVLESSTAAG
jgi:carbon monoxide dehydrogenase subunit G